MDILVQIIADLIFAGLIMSGFGIIVAVGRYFYYRQWRSDKVSVYYDDNDRRKGCYIVKRPRGPYPVGYPKEKIIKDMEDFERLRREQKDKTRKLGRLWAARPMWLRILLMTPAEYKEYRRRRKEGMKR